ncbi:YgfZ/GcvT domain-containing protein [Qipengyuania sp.]|uniref:CAF17-like 4Fe-4S cluster assembly/insertion protein YgfZ n=1 Tax=Qipengyuania sp. TaxID=2004515 RepID=UPI003736355C
MTASRLAARALVRLAPEEPGEDVAGFLQGLVTNDVTGPLPVYAGLLSPQGKTLFDFIVWSGGDDGSLLIDSEAAAADALIRRLSLYRLRRRIAIVPEPRLAVHWQTQDVAGASPDPRLPELGWRWLAPAADDAHQADAAYLAHRLALGVPEGQGETGDILWLETNAAELGGVSFTKGCYVGQENTARMNWRQKVNRRLVVVPLSASDEGRRKAAYPELGLAVDHLRVEQIDVATAPPWLQKALTQPDRAS